VIEHKLMGGTRLNVGGTPTKTVVASADAAHMARRAAEFGVRAPGALTVDLTAVQQSASEVVTRRLDGWLARVRCYRWSV
jgi:pyruvate/2-oxoglutarate dehydrogenase complex dihydrolipoamide dehydrogenase (E3) component